MDQATKRSKLEASHEAYEEQRAQDKYDGKVEMGFALEEFRKSVDYLTGVLRTARFDSEDIGDMVRMALSGRAESAGVEDGANVGVAKLGR